MTAFTYKGYGRIYTNPENIEEVENIIKELSEFEWSYYPGGLVASWDRYPDVEYVGKFELNENKFKEICKERNIPVFIFDNGTEFESYGYQKTLNREELKKLSYDELEGKMTDKLTFCFDEKMIETALIANGWENGWNNEMWVHKNENADYVSYSKKEAFAKLLYKCNLVPENVEWCWKND